MQGSPASEIIDSLFSSDLHDLSKRTTESSRPCQVTVSLASATVTSVRELGLCTRQKKGFSHPARRLFMNSESKLWDKLVIATCTCSGADQHVLDVCNVTLDLVLLEL